MALNTLENVACARSLLWYCCQGGGPDNNPSTEPASNMGPNLMTSSNLPLSCTSLTPGHKIPHHGT